MLDRRSRRLGDSLAVELPALNRAALVRIQVPQPAPLKPLTKQRFRRETGPRGSSCHKRSHHAHTSSANAALSIIGASSPALRTRRFWEAEGLAQVLDKTFRVAVERALAMGTGATDADLAAILREYLKAQIEAHLTRLELSDGGCPVGLMPVSLVEEMLAELRRLHAARDDRNDQHVTDRLMRENGLSPAMRRRSARRAEPLQRLSAWGRRGAATGGERGWRRHRRAGAAARRAGSVWPPRRAARRMDSPADDAAPDRHLRNPAPVGAPRRGRQAANLCGLHQPALRTHRGYAPAFGAGAKVRLGGYSEGR